MGGAPSLLRAAAPCRPVSLHASVLLGAAYLTKGKGGIAAVARLTARALRNQGADLRLLSYRDAEEGDIAGAKWTTAGGSRLAFLARCYLAATTCQRCVYDSVGIARAHPRIAPLRRPYAVWIHGIEVWYGLHSDRARALRDADLVLVNSQATLERFREINGDLPRATVCWLGTEAEAPPATMPTFDGPPTVLALGTMDRDQLYKGHVELIDCWPTVVASVPRARLILAGGGSGVDYIKSRAAQSSVRNQIDVIGFVDESALPSLWQAAHVFALPSRKEGFGIVYVEAMRQGLPVIASVHDAGQEVNVDGETGFNVDLDRAGELAGRLIDLLRSPDLCHRLGQNGLVRWRQHFRFSAFEQRLNAAIGPFLAT